MSKSSVDNGHKWIWLDYGSAFGARIKACELCGRIDNGHNKPCPGITKVTFRESESEHE